MIRLVNFGEENLGEFARSQLEAARRDPRLERGRGAMIADFNAALEEAEQTRTFSIVGLHELRGASDRAQKEHAATQDDEPTPEKAQEQQALWERSAMAAALLDSDNAALNAQTLVMMNGALDAMVEELAPSMQAILVGAAVDKLIGSAEEEVPDAAAQITDEMREQLRKVLPDVVKVPKLEKLRGSGVARYEAVLAGVHLAAPPDRPIPADLDRALTELGAIRDVLVHRAARMDDKALEQAPTLRYRPGDLVRISGDDYRMYSAAIRCYGQEITYRPLRRNAADDEKLGPNLSGWRGYCAIGA
jgi:hypothetical protein